MSWFQRPLFVTPNGVYRPPHWQIECAFAASYLLVLSIAYAMGRFQLTQALFFFTLIAVRGIWLLRDFRTFGALGRPIVAIAQESLIFSRPENSNGALVFALADLQRVQIYGRAGLPTFRFVLQDKPFVETTPIWGARIDDSVIRFLQESLPEKTVVEEPQTLFAGVRGDGPQNE